MITCTKTMSATYSAIHHNEHDRLYSSHSDNDVLSETEMWAVIERDIGALPLYLKNILSINGYNHLLSLEELDETSIQEVEKFARENMKNYVPNTEAYFYIFKKNPADFRIVSGHRKLLLKLRERIRQNGVHYYTQLKVPVIKMMADFYNDEELNSQSEPPQIKPPLDQSIEPTLAPPPSITLTPIDPPEETTIKRRRKQNTIPDIYNEEDKIRLLVYNWYHKYTEEELDMPSIGAAVCDSEEKTYGVVACPLCAIHVKIGAERNKNGSNRWIISNYVKHFQKHHPASFKQDRGFKIEIC
ncbi:uncharacterized protein LOC119648249 isoform X2 [Hermetia illucens]|uniref:uncharacterized protein LOC119648249 isoform X2 n=1 Tax=Hermetia illucens TaxID=343691 RepID=UPI0018CC3B3D|nr:uncharacterized protein LOC119648249 isoform X2 [Hermetia illucens]XP_037905819.1 uncharacterized protein LOC119648249 isoform X2 [Hermetia illucens]